MRKINLIVFMICFLPLLSAASNQGVSTERMGVYKLMLEKNNILAFVSHPKSREHFLNETQRKQDYMLSLKPKIEQLQQQFSSDACVEQFCQEFHQQIDIIMNPLPYEDIVMPFLTCGIANLSGIETREQKKIQEFQIKLFKNYFDRLVGKVWIDCTSELEEFSRDSSLTLFSQLIHPLLHGLLERDEDLDDITYFYTNHAEEEELSDEQKEELEDAFNPQRIKIKIDYSNIDFGIYYQEIEQELYELMFFCGQKKCAGREAMEVLMKEYEEQHFFSSEWLTQVFIDVLEERIATLP